MNVNKVEITDFCTGPGCPPLLISGPCVLEEMDTVMKIGSFMKEAAARHGFNYIFKASFDKANRTSITSYRGPGLEKGLAMLDHVRSSLNVPVITDVHETFQIWETAEVVDVLQIPAFLCRQTDLLVAAAQTGIPVNIKKGQFMAPWDMRHAVRKVSDAGNSRILLTERGSFFGYNNLVVDMRSIDVMHKTGCPVIFDATHSVQLPGGGDGCSSGQREYVTVLARAAVAAGADGIFMEVHSDPESALCDGPNSLDLVGAEKLLSQLSQLYSTIKGFNET